MAIDALSSTSSTVTDKALPKLAPPAPRESRKLDVWDFTKNVLLIILVTKLSAAVGYVAGRFTPNTMLPKRWQALQKTEVMGKKYYPLATYAAFITGSIGGYYEGWRHWRKDKAKQLGVRDIHSDIYTELDPKMLQAETEQNQRIQDGIQKLLERNPRETLTARGSHIDAINKDAVTDAAIVR